MFTTTTGVFTNEEDRKVVDSLRDWSFKHFEKDLQERPSLHRYVETLPRDIIEKIDKLRYSPQILQDICKQFPKRDCNITPLATTDEVYISHYNMDKGGDQGLFDKHYDGNLRFINDATVVRVLIYLSSDDDYVVRFLDSKLSKNFKTYEYGILDFHKELHYVEGSYKASDTSRILLKCNYLVCPKCSPSFNKLNIWFNKAVFFTVKACMEYSKSPKTPMQHVIGFFCNLFRELNMMHPLLPVVIAYLILGIIIWVLVTVVRWVNLSRLKARKKLASRR